MAVIDLGPSRWTQLGSSFGSGLGQGLLQAILEEAERQQQQEQLRQRYTDMLSMASTLGGIPELERIVGGPMPQTQHGIEMREKLIGQFLQPHTVGPGQKVIMGGKTIAEQPAPENRVRVKYRDKEGKAREAMVPENALESFTQKVYEQGGSLDLEDEITKSQKVITQAQSAIKSILGKYDIDQSWADFLIPIGLTAGGETKYEFDFDMLQQFRKNAYQTLQQRAKTDPRAANDLKNVDKWLNVITKAAGGEPWTGRAPSGGAPLSGATHKFIPGKGLLLK